MSAQINFWASNNFINILSSSGLGFFSSAGFNGAVSVGAFNGRTFITDSTGVQQGPEANNVSYLNLGSGIIGNAGSGISLKSIPNYQATLNARFTNDTPCKVQNSYLQAYDRVSVLNPPSGIVFAAANIIHADPTQVNNGSGDPQWRFPAGSSTMSLGATFSPGTSGLSPNGPNTSDTQHDFYIAMSASPNTVGSKSWAILVSIEYY